MSAQVDSIQGFTQKQISILRVIMRGNKDGTFVDLDQLLLRINYKTTKQSMQFSIRALMDRGYIIRSNDTTTRRRKARRLLMPTAKAFKDYQTYVGNIE